MIKLIVLLRGFADNSDTAKRKRVHQIKHRGGLMEYSAVRSNR